MNWRLVMKALFIMQIALAIFFSVAMLAGSESASDALGRAAMNINIFIAAYAVIEAIEKRKEPR